MLRSIFSLVNTSEMEVGFLSALSKKKNIYKNVYLKLNENQGSFRDGFEIHESGFCSRVCICLVGLSSMDVFSLPQNKEGSASLGICCCVVGCHRYGLFQKIGQF